MVVITRTQRNKSRHLLGVQSLSSWGNGMSLNMLFTLGGGYYMYTIKAQEHLSTDIQRTVSEVSV